MCYYDSIRAFFGFDNPFKSRLKLEPIKLTSRQRLHAYELLLEEAKLIDPVDVAHTFMDQWTDAEILAYINTADEGKIPVDVTLITPYNKRTNKQ